MKMSPLKTKRRLDGSIFMVMSSVSPNRSLFLQQLLDLELSYLPCKTSVSSDYLISQALKGS